MNRERGIEVMGHTHRFRIDDEMRVCTKCGKELPNTNEYFSYANRKIGRLASVCKDCTKEINKKRKEEIIEQNKNKDLFYEGTRKCKKCGRELPNNKLYFSIDLACLNGLRHVCRECSKKEKGFLEPDYDPHTKWSDEDLELLKRVYKDFTNEELVQLYFPNRTIRSVECMGGIIGMAGKEYCEESRAKELKSMRQSIALKGRKMSDEQKRHISEIKKEYYKTHDSWAKGADFSQEHRKHISEAKIKAEKWKGTNNPRHTNPLFGENNGRWQGGITDLYKALRNGIGQWQRDSMESCKFKCIITNGEFDEIHHTTSFRDIVDLVFEDINIDKRNKIEDYNDDELDIIYNELYKYHILYGYGACLHKDVHKLFHDNYGYTKFNSFDFLDFCYRIDCGEFDNWFVEHNLNIEINYNYIEYLENIINEIYEEELAV